MVIVYQSHTGFTKEYAQMLGKAEKIKTYTLDEASHQLLSGTQVFYMGPLTAGHIDGLDRAMKRYQVQGVCGVGMSMPGEGTMASLRRSNYVGDAPLFYLQGGWAPKKVGWLKCRMVNMVTRSTRKTLEAKGSARTPQEQAMLDMLLHGGSFVAFEHLEPIRAWLKSQG